MCGPGADAEQRYAMGVRLDPPLTLTLHSGNGAMLDGVYQGIGERFEGAASVDRWVTGVG